MTTRREKPDWEQFQDLVARIEKSLAPKGAVIQSPDRVKDLVTGRLREVDASIRFQVGSAPILITVECRKRKGVQDDTWIEQLATKRSKIGAAKTIAVSATGFSDSAMKTAALHGIELRKLEDRIGEEIVSQFFSGFQVTMLVTDYRAVSIGYAAEDRTPVPETEFAATLKEALASGDLNAAIARERSTGNAVTFNSIIKRVDDGDVPEDGTPHLRVITVTFNPGTIEIDTVSGPRFLHGIQLRVEFRRHAVPAPATAFYEYASPDQIFRRTSQHTAPLPDGSGAYQLHVDIDSPAFNRRDTAKEP